MSYSKLYYHIVWRTYNSLPTIPENKKRIMFKYIHEICETNKWKLIRINSHIDHIHMLIELNASDPLANVIQKLKGATSGTFK